MSGTRQWIGRNLSLGGLVRNAGRGLGITANIAVRVAGSAVTLVARNPQTKRKIERVAATTGKVFDVALTKGSAIAGEGINYSIQGASLAVGRVSGGVTKAMGASPDRVALAESVGTVVGAMAVGAIAGAGIADAAVAFGAAAGTAGGAATTSGLAALGGGSVAAGGGGMAAGHAVMQCIVAGGGASGAASLQSNANKPED